MKTKQQKALEAARPPPITKIEGGRVHVTVEFLCGWKEVEMRSDSPDMSYYYRDGVSDSDSGTYWEGSYEISIFKRPACGGRHDITV